MIDMSKFKVSVDEMDVGWTSRGRQVVLSLEPADGPKDYVNPAAVIVVDDEPVQLAVVQYEGDDGWYATPLHDADDEVFDDVGPYPTVQALLVTLRLMGAKV